MRRPVHPNLQHAYKPGPVVAMTVRTREQIAAGEPGSVSLVAIGHGRTDLAQLRESARELTATGVLRATVAPDTFASIGEALAEWPEADMDATCRAMAATEKALAEHAQAVAQWEADLAAAGQQPCERCGGAGGYRGWPGFTCYECGGSGSTAVEG